MRGKGVFYLRQVRCPTVSCGWTVCPVGISSDSVVYSFGIGDNINFDLFLIEKFGVDVHAFDPTPMTAEWLARQTLPAKFRYHAVALSNRDGVADFFAPVEGRKCHTLQERVPGQASTAQVPVRRLKTIMTELGHDRIDILKIDIEGAEYDVIDDLIRERIPVKQLLIEFHHRFPTIGVKKTKDAIRMLKEAGYRIFWVSRTCNEYAFMNISQAVPDTADQ
jgi:FkbM family methyltransferase